MPAVSAKADTAAVGLDVWFGFGSAEASSSLKIHNNLDLKDLSLFIEVLMIRNYHLRFVKLLLINVFEFQNTSSLIKHQIFH